MTTVARPPAPGQPGTGLARASQATAIEQTRAAAEVYAAVMVARELPRNVSRAEQDMRTATARPALAERAFFRYSRGGDEGKPVTGPTIQLARELARCWGNIQYEVTELRRDDENHESEMLAWAWDLETNTRSAIGFVVPHVRDLKNGARRNLVAVRDVYENNANMGARRLRECIFSVLPGYFVEEAKERCTATLAKGGDGKTLSQQITDVIEYYAKNGVTADQLEQKLGRGSNDWTPLDVAQLGIIGRAIRGGETTKDEEFPPSRVTVAEIQAQAIAAAEAAAARAQAAAVVPAEQEAEDERLAGALAAPVEQAGPGVDSASGPAPDPGSDEARKAERAAAFTAEQTRRRNARTAKPSAAVAPALLPVEDEPRDPWADVEVAQPHPGDVDGVTTGGTE